MSSWACVNPARIYSVTNISSSKFDRLVYLSETGYDLREGQVKDAYPWLRQPDDALSGRIQAIPQRLADILALFASTARCSVQHCWTSNLDQSHRADTRRPARPTLAIDSTAVRSMFSSSYCSSAGQGIVSAPPTTAQPVHRVRRVPLRAFHPVSHPYLPSPFPPHTLPACQRCTARETQRLVSSGRLLLAGSACSAVSRRTVVALGPSAVSAAAVMATGAAAEVGTAAEVETAATGGLSAPAEREVVPAGASDLAKLKAHWCGAVERAL